MKMKTKNKPLIFKTIDAWSIGQKPEHYENLLNIGK